MDTFAISRQRLFLALLLLATIFFVPSTGFAAVPNKSAVPAYAEEQTILQAEKDVPEVGRSSASSGKVHIDRHYLGQYGASEGGVILQRGGNTWRTLRDGPIATVAGTVMLVVPLLLLGFYLLTGPERLEHPETGQHITRFSAWDRIVHWSTAISFLVLAFTGLIVMFGKKLLLPWMGNTVFSWIAIVSKYLHNFIGPLFIVCSLLMFFTFLSRNFFERIDWQWIKSGGGLISHRHVPAGYFNAGEKLWFWGGVVLLGIIMSISGLILDFVTFGQTRYVLQWANYFHIGGATLYIVGALSHIYMGTLGDPLAYRAMRHGTVDVEWARENHAYWYEQLRAGAPHMPPADVPPHPRHH
jgi:formate dehydrogenase subunit gamma